MTFDRAEVEQTSPQNEHSYDFFLLAQIIVGLEQLLTVMDIPVVLRNSAH